MITHPKPVRTHGPTEHVEPCSKVTLIILTRHVAYLDALSIAIRLRSGQAVARTELIRGFIDFMQCSRIDFSRFASADEITRFLVQRFRAYGRNRPARRGGPRSSAEEQPPQSSETKNVPTT